MERYINSVGWLAMASCMFILGCTQPSTSKNDSQPDRPSAESESAEIAEAFEAKQQTLAATQNSESFFTVDLYDPQRDAVKDLEMTVSMATQSNKRILIEVGGKW